MSKYTSRWVPANQAEARSIIEQRAQALADETLLTKALRGQLRSGKEFAKQVARDYGDRFLLELLQNSYDAETPGSESGRVSIILNLQESSFGVLYFANSGAPFDTEDFRAICEMAQTSKRPGQGIGNKGVGFRSVLQVCEWPESYSTSGADPSEGYDGFCFSFARPDDFLRIARGDEANSELLQDLLSAYSVPFPLVEQDDGVQAFARGGFNTLIRMPLRNAVATEKALAQLQEIALSPPVILFLDRLKTIDIRIVDDDARAPIHLEREVVGSWEASGTHFDQVALKPEGEFLVATRTVDPQVFRAGIERSIEAQTLDEQWREWEDEARISVALSLDSALDSGRLYAFLPMGTEARAPVPAHLNAPFVVRLARDNLIQAAPLNDLLLDEAADLCASAALELRNWTPSRLQIPDLVTWSPPHHVLLLRAFERCGTPLVDAAVVPIIGDRGWSCLRDTYDWPDQDLGQVTAERLSRSVPVPILDPAIGAVRRERVNSLHRQVCNGPMTPSLTTIADWSEPAARDLLKSSRGTAGVGPETWLQFYDDLASLFGASGNELAGKRIILDDSGRLRCCWQPAGSPGDSKGPAIFFHSSAEEDTDEVDAPEGVRIPRSLARHLAYTNSALKWKVFNEDTRRYENRPGREFLERRRLVRLPRRQELLNHVASVLSKTKSENTFKESLQFVYRLDRGPRPYNQEPRLNQLGLRVPARKGWVAAESVRFGKAWGTTLGEQLEELIAGAGPACPEIESLADRLLVAPQEWPFRIEAASWLPFLRTIGVRDGLWPEELPLRETRRHGQFCTPSIIGRDLKLGEYDLELWSKGVEREGGRPQHPYTEYRLAGPVHRIPGQSDYPALPSRARTSFARLMVAGLEEWPDSSLRFSFGRPRSSGVDQQDWPAPSWTFLRYAPWMPVTRPAEPGTTDFVAADRAWHSPEDADSTPLFAPLIAKDLRRRIDAIPLLRDRLRRLGVAVWTDPSTASARIDLLGRLFDEGLADSQLASFRRAYEAAWSVVIDRKQGLPWQASDDVSFLVVTRHGQLTTFRFGSGPESSREPLYAIGARDPLAEILLTAMDVPVLCVDPKDGSAAAELLLEVGVSGTRVIRSDDFHVFVDGTPLSALPDGPLLADSDRTWLADLLALTLELKSTAFNRQSEKTIREAVEALRTIRLRAGSQLKVELEGADVPLPSPLQNVLSIGGSNGRALVFQGDEQVPDWATLQRLAPGIAELVGQPWASSALELVVVGLGSLAGIEGPLFAPTDEDYARVFRQEAERIRETRRSHRVVLDELVYLLRPLIYYFSGPSAELDFTAASREAGSPDLLPSILRRSVGNDEEFPDVDKLMEVARGTQGLAELRDAYEVPYAEFNRCLIELGPPYRPFRNKEGQAAAFRAFLHDNREKILGSLRSCYLPQFEQNQALDGYRIAKEAVAVALGLARENLTIPQLTPSEQWLDEVHIPSDEQMGDRINNWLTVVGASPLADQMTLSTLAEVQEPNRRMAERTLDSAAKLIPAWYGKKAEICPEPWNQTGASANITQQLLDQGILDFRLLTLEELLKWLQTLGVWPEDMRCKTDPNELGLTEEDLLVQEDAAKTKRRQEEYVRHSVLIDGKRLSLEPDETAELVKTIEDGLSDEFLAATQELAELSLVQAVTKRPHRGGPTGRPRRPTERQKEIIGFVGELAAFRWLQRRYSASPEVWRSRNRRFLFPDYDGDDSLGFDFEVPQRRGTTLMFEVKASSGESRFAIELGESEIRAAQVNAGNKRYRILYVANALNSEHRRLVVLPNPLSPSSRGFYRVTGTGVRYEFRPAGEDA